MHIIGGKLKGKKLANYKSQAIRPAMALVRKSIFDTLKDFVIDSSVLDLCAGTGIIGIEALSRGAKKLTAIESDKNAVRLINKNLRLCNISAEIILGKLPEILNKKKLTGETFDLIFLDPPYGQSSLIEETLNGLIFQGLIAKEGIVLIESELKSDFLIPSRLSLYKEKLFGNTKLTILKH